MEGDVNTQHSPASQDSPPARPSPHQRLISFADRHRAWLLVIIPLLYFAGFNGRWLISPDSALYASLGKSLAHGQGYTYQGEHHTWVEPGLPLVIGIGFKLFGDDAFWPTMLVLMACGFVALWLFYRLMLLHAGRGVAVVLVGLLAFNETFYRYPLFLFTDIPFLAFVLLFLLGYEAVFKGVRMGGAAWQDYLKMAAGTFGMAATRPAYSVFIAAVVVAAAWHIFRNQRRREHVIIVIIVVASVLAFRIVDPRRAKVAQSSVIEERMWDLVVHRPGYMIQRSLTQLLPELFNETAVEAVFGSRMGPGVTAILAGITIGLGILLMTERPLWGLYIGATIAQMLIHLPRERYFLPILPLLLYALWKAAVWLDLRLRPPARAWAFGGVIFLLLVPNVPVIFGDILQQHDKPFIEKYEHGRYAPLLRIVEPLKANVGLDDLVLADEDRVLSYFSDRRVIPSILARRWRARDVEIAQFWDRLRRAPAVYAVVLNSGERSQRRAEQGEKKSVAESVKELGMKLGPALATEGKWSLHKVELPAKGINKGPRISNLNEPRASATGLVVAEEPVADARGS